MVALSASAPLIKTPIHHSHQVLPPNATRQPTAPTPSKCDVSNVYHQKILTLYRRLQNLESLSPSEETNAIFTDLVEFVVKTQLCKSDLYKLMQLHKMPMMCEEIRKMCAKAETLLEEHWSKRLTSGESPLDDFPYHNNYINLTRMEYHLLCGQGAQPQHVMFIGSGPLPLSSLTLASRHLAKDWINGDWSILNVDLCPQANQMGSNFAAKAFPELSKNITFMDCDAAHVDPAAIKKFDVIYLAALVGLDMKSKQDIVCNLVMHMKSGSRLLLRSVTGLRRLLYPEVDECALIASCKGELDLEVICHPRNFVINSVVIARRM